MLYGYEPTVVSATFEESTILGESTDTDIAYPLGLPGAQGYRALRAQVADVHTRLNHFTGDVLRISHLATGMPGRRMSWTTTKLMKDVMRANVQGQGACTLLRFSTWLGHSTWNKTAPARTTGYFPYEQYAPPAIDSDPAYDPPVPLQFSAPIPNGGFKYFLGALGTLAAPVVVRDDDFWFTKTFLFLDRPSSGDDTSRSRWAWLFVASALQYQRFQLAPPEHVAIRAKNPCPFDLRGPVPNVYPEDAWPIALEFTEDATGDEPSRAQWVLRGTYGGNAAAFVADLLSGKGWDTYGVTIRGQLSQTDPVALYLEYLDGGPLPGLEEPPDDA